MNDVLKIISIADLHFDVLDPEVQYNILTDQFTNKLNGLFFDMITICGDIFEHKTMSNSKAVFYAMKFINDLVELCRPINASLIIIGGTREHDADQLQLFYGYRNDPTVDVYVLDSMQFIETKGIRILCIPELYGKGADYYNQFFHGNGQYDIALVHGTFVNSIYGSGNPTLDTQKSPIFCMDDFGNCKGLIISGHVHTPGCFESYYYYTGSPLRWKFGEEHEKGFLISLYNKTTREHYSELVPIQSFKYITINLDNMLMNDPQEVIAYVIKLKEEHHIDHIRLEFLKVDGDLLKANFQILNEYYRAKRGYHIKADFTKAALVANQQALEELSQYSYILDKNLSDEEKFVRYINDNMGYEYMTVDKLLSVLSEMV